MFEPPDTIEALASAIDRCFFAPLRRPRTRRVGVELELPVWNRTPGKATDFDAVHDATEEFLARFDFPDTALDDTGALAGKSKYRAYLAGKYGKRLMVYCGIHVNFSFAERLVSAAGVDRDEFYLHVASQCIKWGWVIVALTAASPAGQYASVRCSEKGYWNRFVPILDFSSVRAYAKSIARYVQDGLLIAPSELYYPVRLKPRGPNSLLSLVERGIDHIEIRCVDLNPLTGGLVDARDIEFVRLFLLWCAAQKREALSVEKQKESVAAFKAAARIDFDWTSVGEVLERMDEFFAGSAGWPPSVQRVLAFEAEKVYHPGNRYAWMEACHV